MNAPPLIRSLRRTLTGQMPAARCAWKQSMATRPTHIAFRSMSAASKSVDNAAQSDQTAEDDPLDPRLPRSVQALYMQPLRRECEFGVPSCDLQLRSFTLPNLEFFSDFALRAAYYLGLPAFGPVPLPRIIERWTVPRSHFIYKKSQENYERITLRRLIQIRDGHPETVQLWLAYLQKHAYPGLGMKANIFEFDSLDVGKTMDTTVEGLSSQLDSKWAHLGEGKVRATAEKAEEILSGSPEFQAALTEAKAKLAKDRQAMAGGL
ncbi:30s ribosomal protein s10 [Ophiostoma piceae UAMH 11346]|uniref:Small ribosomal subunit protein uS10m n=1 Tax=Ophiostoma piceae (strain UAMH 11346) TaxID=1262450 RepID=S3C0I1_OPHP1|nr:30s ribosomal protein s10 [Ophiostoma piceae UAMH 11346]